MVDVTQQNFEVEVIASSPRVPVLGDFFRLTYIYNRGAAFGLHVGEYSRYVFLALTVLAVNILGDGLRDTLDPKFGKRGASA